MKKKIEVSDYHIRHGTRGSPAYCPVALALWTRTPVGHLEVAENGLCTLYQLHIPPWSGTRVQKSAPLPIPIMTFQLPEAAIAWLLKYDKTGEGDPFWFEVDIPTV